MFSHFGQFSKVLGQFRTWFILELQENIGPLFQVACSILFIFLCDRGWQERVLKFMKNCQF